MLGKRMKELRNERGLTQELLGEALGFGTSRIGMYECGRRQPDHETLQMIAGFFGVSVDYLLGHSNVRQFYKDTPSNGSTNEKLCIYKTVKEIEIDDLKVAIYDELYQQLVKLNILSEDDALDEDTQSIMLKYIKT